MRNIIILPVTARIIAAFIFFVPMQAAYASLIEVPYAAATCCIGEYEPTTQIASYWAQTFRAPAEKLGDLKIWGLNNQQYPGSVFEFALLITTTSQENFQPTQVLYESQRQSVSNQFITEFTFDLSQLSFIRDNKYSFIIDTYVTRDGKIDVGQIATTAPPVYDAYQDGALYYLFATENGRVADLNAQWYESGLDISFSLGAPAVLATPIPAAAWLLISGAGLLGAAAKRRKTPVVRA